jgi:hypothetical protein
MLPMAASNHEETHMAFDPKDLKERDRTFADRKAFILAESTIETAAALAAANAPKPVTLDTSAVVDPNWKKDRERRLLREAVESAKQKELLRVIGETVYRALPFDEDEKSPHRETILEQTAELASSMPDWKLSPAGMDLAEAVSSLSSNSENPDAVHAAVSASLSEGGELLTMVDGIASGIETRVVEAVVSTRERAAETEARLAEVKNLSEGDAELEAARVRRAMHSTPPTIMEALFTANTRVLSEAGVSVDPDLLMVEAVSQYTLLETLSALGVMPQMQRADTELFARRLSNRKK